MILPFRRPEPDTVAAVDLGSNSFHMIVCRNQNGELVVIDRLKEMVRLAAGIDKDKILSEEAQQRALDCLARFGQRLRDVPDNGIRVVGTNTLRSAANATEFIEKAESCLGHPIDIISGVEEARLIYLGVARSIAATEERRLVMDIGGGSTELIIGEKFEPLYLESLYMGCVSMSRRFFPDGVISEKSLLKAEVAAEQELEPFVTRFRLLDWQEAIGASGTIRAIYKIVHAEGWAEDGITLKSLKTLMDAVASVTHINELKVKELDPERAPVFVGGLVILYATFKLLGIKKMRVADGALREGLIHDLLGRIHHEDVRTRSVRALAERYHADTDHAARVQQTARRLFEMLSEPWGLDEQAQNYLEWACMLCEVGIEIAHSHYQKHGAYIIEHADIAGFSQQEQRLLATLVLSHRRKLNMKVFKSLPKKWQKPALRLTIILRLAALLNRSRTPVTDAIAISVKKNTLLLEINQAWLTEHSLTMADLEVEADYLQSIDYTLKLNDSK